MCGSFAFASAFLTCISPTQAAPPVGPDFLAFVPPPNTLYVDTLDLSGIRTEAKEVIPGQSAWHRQMQLGGVRYPHGLGLKGVSEMTIDLKGVATTFESMVGVDDAFAGNGSVEFTVRLDGREVFDSGPMQADDEPKLAKVDCAGGHKLTLLVAHVGTDKNTWADNADWAGALIRTLPSATVRPASDAIHAEAQLPVSRDESQAEIHGPGVLGVSPQAPFFYRVPFTGDAPTTLRASGLPAGVTLDSSTGTLRGMIATAGTSTVTLTAGASQRELTIVCGNDKRALTPPMGWNAFGVLGDTATDAQVRNAADELVKSGLAAHGYRYVCLGDAWQGTRDADGRLRPNRRFPDMRALANYIHAKGLLFGLYSAATPQSCSGYVGSQGHETEDAQTFASWGVDYLTYDWCPSAVAEAAQTGASTAPAPRLQAASAEDMVPAFSRMSEALAKTGRDIVFAVSVQRVDRYQSQSDDPSSWAVKVGADTFSSSSGLYDDDKVIRDYATSHQWLAGRAGAGHWADLGPLMVGRVGYPKPHLTLLTPAEQMTQITYWAMLSAPFFVSCDLEHLNPNTKNKYTYDLLTNDDVLAIDQDPAPKAPKSLNNGSVWTRQFADGRVAVALFNDTHNAARVQVNWSDIGLTGAQPVYDLWQRKALPVADGSFTAVLPTHGVAFVVVGAAKGVGGG